MSYVAPITVPTKSVPFLRKLVPGYKRRDVRIKATTKVTFSDLNWSGGSRSTYSLYDLSDGRSMSLAGWSQLAPWANPYEGASTKLIPGFMVVEDGVFCGKQGMLTLHVHPDNLTPLLAAA